MEPRDFQKAIEGLLFERAEAFESVGSTNDVVAEWTHEGTTGICLAFAEEQTRGRGRSGRRWFTPPGSALAFSLLLDLTAANQATLGKLSGLGALAVCEGLESLYGLSPRIKWPNDVLLDGKKVCGVLAEAHWSGERMQALILGIGINVARTAVPPAELLDFPAASVEEIIGASVDRPGLLRKILERVLHWKERLDEKEFINSWQQRLAYLNESIRLERLGAEPTVGVVKGLRDDGSLKLQVDGEPQYFQAGEIHLRPLSN
ncbi:MAG: biotin--[acetyl-CoA-carboxylase] ligase [Anaerolineales bacterium]